MTNEHYRILAIDDQPDNLIALKAVILDAFPTIRLLTASDGPSGIALAKKEMPDVVLLNVLIPGMDGFEACRSLKADPLLRPVPIVFLTATRTDKESRIKALESGAEAFLTQPIDDVEVTAQINAMLKISAANKAQQQQVDALETQVAQRTRTLVQELEERRKGDDALHAKHLELQQQKKAMLNLLEDLATENETRKKKEAALIEAESRFRMLFESLSDAVFIGNEADNFVLTNLAATELLGYSAEEYLRMGPPDIVAPEYHANRARYTRNLYKEERALFESVLVHRDGAHIPVEVNSRLITFDGIRATISIVRDITERHKSDAEKEALQQSLTQAQKMESVGRLAGGVAHDFNNMLGVIMGNIEMAMDALPSDNPARADLEEARQAAKRSAQLTRQLLTFARKEKAKPQALDLNQTIEGMSKMLARLIGEDINMKWIPSEGLWSVWMDPSHVDQILANLCVNARDAISRTGQVRIETANTTVSSSSSKRSKNIAPGEYVVVSVTDTGCGMDAETQANIFDPFFTTKKHGEGTGLGLATVYGIVKQSNGSIVVESVPDHGTRFLIYLPRWKSEGDSGEASEKSFYEVVVGGTETILLVEDEEGILKICSAVLSKMGYTVLTANTPGDAIRIADAHGDTIDLIITDVVMPEMDGPDLANRLSKKFPAMKHMFMSGYTADILFKHGISEKEMICLSKPFTKRELAAHVRKALSQE